MLVVLSDVVSLLSLVLCFPFLSFPFLRQFVVPFSVPCYLFHETIIYFMRQETTRIIELRID